MTRNKVLVNTGVAGGVIGGSNDDGNGGTGCRMDGLGYTLELKHCADTVVLREAIKVGGVYF